jgi:hypothetical protein
LSPAARRWAIASFLIGGACLLASGALTSETAQRAFEARRRVAEIPATVASLKAQDAANAAIRAKQIANLKARLAREAARPPLPALTDNEASKAIAVIDSQIGKSLTPAQVATFRAELQKPNQRFIDPAIALTTQVPGGNDANTISLPLQLVRGSKIDPRGGILFDVIGLSSLSGEDGEGAFCYNSADGEIRMPKRPTSAEIIARAEAPVAVNMPPFPPPGYAEKYQHEEIAMFACAAPSLVNSLIAVSLLVVSVLTVRGARRWIDWHRAYAWMQLSIIFVVAVVWLVLYAYTPAGAESAWIFKTLSIGTAVAAIYPLIILRKLPRDSDVAES